jgi:hypothetical protein
MQVVMRSVTASMHPVSTQPPAGSPQCQPCRPVPRACPVPQPLTRASSYLFKYECKRVTKSANIARIVSSEFGLAAFGRLKPENRFKPEKTEPS